MIEVFGYLAAALIGVSLGLIGGGGSILTVPVLVFLFGIQPEKATALSLFIVGVTAAASAADYARRREIDFAGAISFVIPSVIGVYLMRRLFIPVLPQTILTIGSFSLSKDRAILLLFGLVMLASSWAMIRRTQDEVAADRIDTRRLGWQGFATGLVSGAVGAGGGFLIVPALTLVAKIPMRRAVATSLLVIAINSLIGFTGDLQSGRTIPWSLVLSVSGIAIAGCFFGAHLGRFVPGARLKPAFGIFILAMGVFVILSQVLAKH